MVAFSWFGAALGDADLGRAQHAFADGEAFLDHLRDGAGGQAFVMHLEQGLVEIRVEFLALGFQLAHAMAGEARQEIALGQLDALDEGFQRVVGLGAGLGGHAFQRAA